MYNIVYVSKEDGRIERMCIWNSSSGSSRSRSSSISNSSSISSGSGSSSGSSIVNHTFAMKKNHLWTICPKILFFDEKQYTA